MKKLRDIVLEYSFPKCSSGDEETELTDENVLSELSKDTLRSYIHKSMEDYGDRKFKQGKNPTGDTSDSSQKRINRRIGVTRATRKLAEDSSVPANVAGAGNIASIGVGEQGEPGVKPAVMGLIRRKNLDISKRTKKEIEKMERG